VSDDSKSNESVKQLSQVCFLSLALCNAVIWWVLKLVCNLCCHNLILQKVHCYTAQSFDLRKVCVQSWVVTKLPYQACLQKWVEM
jgi:hypothetical protein